MSDNTNLLEPNQEIVGHLDAVWTKGGMTYAQIAGGVWGFPGDLTPKLSPLVGQRAGVLLVGDEYFVAGGVS